MLRHGVDNREDMVDQRVLVARARESDHAAFATLTEHHQAMALGYTLSILGDYQLAQDATQEALPAAYRGLPSLEDGARLPAWLRGIVRFQCGGVRRKRPIVSAWLDAAWDMPPTLLGTEQQLEVKEGFHRAVPRGAAVHLAAVCRGGAVHRETWPDRSPRGNATRLQGHPGGAIR